MEPLLTFEEGRVLGCLIEKAMATPEYYPMTANALMAACNQKSSRNPVVAFDSGTIETALMGLREKGLATLVHQSGARGAKNKHRVDEKFPELQPAQVALLAVLLLRGQQSVGELRTRTERLHRFGDLGAVERGLEPLLEYVPEPLVREVPAGGGRHVKSYVVRLVEGVEEVVAEPVVVPAVQSAPAGGATDEGLKEELDAVKAELAALRAEFEAFKAQF